jgi:hypothetical protein
MADKWSKYEVTPETKVDKWAKYEVQPPAAEPDWFMPGSKSEAAVRGFSNAASLGLGNKLQAYLRAIGDDTGGKQSYLERARTLEDEERIANATAASTNPKSYIAGNIVGSLPAAANIANVARGAAPILQSQALGSAARGAGAGATYGAIQGAGASDSDYANLLSSMGKQAAIGAGTGALTGGLAGKAIDKSQAAMAANLAGKEAPPVTATAAGTIANQISLPALGALGGMGYRNVQSDNPTDWTNDPYSAALETGIAGAKGAALGAAAKYGTKAAGALSEKIPAIVDKGFTKLGKAVDEVPGKVLRPGPPMTIRDTILGTPGTTLERSINKSNQGGDQDATDRAADKPFGKISSYIERSQGVTNPEIVRMAQAADESDEDARKKAMALQGSPSGRAVTNSESPERA